MLPHSVSPERMWLHEGRRPRGDGHTGIGSNGTSCEVLSLVPRESLAWTFLSRTGLHALVSVERRKEEERFYVLRVSLTQNIMLGGGIGGPYSSKLLLLLQRRG